MDLLAEPLLAQTYAHITQEGPLTVRKLMDALDLLKGTASSYVNRLVDVGVIESVTDDQPRTDVANEIDLTVTAADGDREYTITPALIDAVGRGTTDDNVDTYIDRHGPDGPPVRPTKRRGLRSPGQSNQLDTEPLTDCVLQVA